MSNYSNSMGFDIYKAIGSRIWSQCREYSQWWNFLLVTWIYVAIIFFLWKNDMKQSIFNYIYGMIRPLIYVNIFWIHIWAPIQRQYLTTICDCTRWLWPHLAQNKDLFSSWHITPCRMHMLFCSPPLLHWSGIASPYMFEKSLSFVLLFSQFCCIFKHGLATEQYIYIGQVSSQLSCGGTCPIWMFFK